MSKAVLISIKPKWVEKIANGYKTIEVRRSRPKIETPFKCYIYATKSGNRIILKNDRVFEISKALTGKVIGDFVCNSIEEYKYEYCPHPEINMDFDCGDNWYDIDDEDLLKTCLTQEEFKKYGKGKSLYGWHISDLKIYDKPKELGEFRKPCYYKSAFCLDEKCEYWGYSGCENFLTRPFQSWGYVEE